MPVDFVARAMDHIAHMADDELHGDTFHLVDPEPMTVGEALNEFAKAAHAPQFAMRDRLEHDRSRSRSRCVPG